MAAVESTEEPVINSLAAAEDMTTLRPPGRVCRAIDMEALVAAVIRGQGREESDRARGDRPLGQRIATRIEMQKRQRRL